MSLRYGRNVTILYTEILLRVLLNKLSCAQKSSVQDNQSSVEIRLNNKDQHKNIIQFDSQEKSIILVKVDNYTLSTFLQNNITKIIDINLISCCCQAYLFTDGNRNPEKKANAAQKKMNLILKGKSISRDDIGAIFTELNNAGVIEKKTQRFYSSPIKISLIDLTEDSIEKYIQEICGAGGKLDKYLYLSRDHQRNKSDLNPKLILMMKLWAEFIFNCDIEQWETSHWKNFENEWNNQYDYSPNPEHIKSMLIWNYNVGNFNQRLCIYLYNFLKTLNDRIETQII